MRRLFTRSGQQFGGQKVRKMGRKPKTVAYDWTEEKEEMLISFWESNDFLYNLANKNYKNQQKKDKAYEEIAAKIGTTGKLGYNIGPCKAPKLNIY